VNNLLTLKQIASELNLPPSTVAFYKNTFSEYMPAVKIGRYVKYEPAALEIIAIISKGFKNNQEQQQIKELLNSKFALNIEEMETEPTTTTVTTTTQQQPTALEKASLKALAQANSEIFFLRDLVKKQTALIEELSRPWYEKFFIRKGRDNDK
jgi:DNA-binding transcriptional MerR regulator